MIKHIGPGITKATLFLRQSIDQGVWNRPPGLPGITRLAHAAGVSRATMWKALQVLRAEGHIEGVPGRRFRVVAAAGDTNTEKVNAPEANRVPRWRILVEELDRDILTGRLPADKSLPQLMELVWRYKTTYRPMKQALEILRRQGVLYRRGRTYEVASSMPSVSHARIVLLCQEGTHRVLSTVDADNSTELFRSIERECLRRRLQLDVVDYAYSDNSLVFIDSHNQRFSHIPTFDTPTLGYLVRLSGYPRLTESLLEFIFPNKVPLAIIDEGGVWDQFLNRPSTCPVTVFRVGLDAAPGEQMARYLLGLGHRQIAYITPFHESPWSQNRFAGLRHTFEAAGCYQAVSLKVLEKFHYRFQYGQQMCREYHLEDFLESCRKIEQLFLPRDSAENTSLPLMVIQYLQAEAIRQRLVPVFDEVLVDRSITALVGCNDQVALAALGYLRVRHWKVPHTLTVVGFDDIPDAFDHELTSFSFNVPMVVRAAVDFIVSGGRQPTLARNRRFCTIEGMVTQRRSSGPAIQRKS